MKTESVSQNLITRPVASTLYEPDKSILGVIESTDSQVQDTTPYSLISFILAIILSFVSVLLAVLLALLFYKTFSSPRTKKARSINQSEIIVISEYI